MNNNDVKLDVGAIERILNSDTSHEPVVQVLDIKRIQTSNSGERFRLVISDGKYFIQGMLATQLSNLIKTNHIKKHTIIKLNEFVTNAINGRKICVVIKCAPVSNPGIKIGNPISITQKPNNNLMNNNINNNSGNPGFRPNNNNNYRNNNNYNNNYNNYNNSGNNFVNNNNVNFRPISSLNPYQSGWTIKVRCTSKDPMRFYKNQRGDGKVFSVDLIDNQGGEIRASMFNEAATKYYDTFEKNKVYSISKGTVKIARKGYTHIKNDYSIVLNADAEIIELPNDNTISTLNYNFIEINELRHVADKEFVDVIGIITNISELRTILSKKTSKELICRNISLTDKTGTIDCTLWSGDAKGLSEDSIGQIIAFKGARISSYGGKSLNPGSSLEYSPNNQQSIDLKVWYQSQNGNINTDNKLTDNTISNKQRRTLSEVHEQDIGAHGEIDEKTGKKKPQYFNVLGTVQTISAAPDKKPWYLSVHPDEEKNEKQQKFKVTPNGDGTYMCDKNGKSYNKCLPRYILRFLCADFSSNIWLTAFDENGTKILNNVTATQANDYLEGNNIEEFNKIFKSANFKRFVFTCRAREDMWEDRKKMRFDVQNVQKANFVSESKSLIKKIQDMRSL